MSEATIPAVPPTLDRDFVLKRCRYFASVNLWPAEAGGLYAERWLDQFEPHEQLHALYLLNGFIFLSTAVTRRMFLETIRGLSRHFVRPSMSADKLRADWRAFLERVVFLPIRGERPRDEDSGMLFTRIARDQFELDPDRNLPTADAAIERVLADKMTPVVFVDDFVGTGNQFLSTFKRRHELPSGIVTSFEELAANGRGRYWCCPVVACSQGVARLARRAPSVVVSAGNELPDVYSVFSPNSVIWPDDLRASAPDVIEGASRRAGIPDHHGSPDDWRGFGGLGLTLGFDHGKPPDATLPLFGWRSETWKPLYEVAP